MTSKRADAVNRAIAAALGLEVRQNKDKFEQTKYHIFPAVEDFLSDYATDMNAAIAAAGELLPGRWQLIHFNSGFRFDWSDNTDKWYDIHPKSNAPADIAAAICEAIVTARQLVVESEVESE